MKRISLQVVRLSPLATNKATQAQYQLEGEEAAFYNTLTADYNTQFANQSAILKGLTSTFMPILQAGPGQQGFTASEQAAMRTSSAENIANNFQAASQAVNERLGALGGGNAYLPSGAEAQVNAGLAAQAASQNAATQNQITMASYQQGLQNFQEAAAALGQGAGLYNPLGYAGQGTEAGNSAFNMATTIQEENSSWEGELGGALGGIASSALGAYTGGAIGGAKPGGGGGDGQLDADNWELF